MIIAVNLILSAVVFVVVVAPLAWAVRASRGDAPVPVKHARESRVQPSGQDTRSPARARRAINPLA